MGHALSALASPAESAVRCGNRDAILAGFWKKHGEKPQALGLSSTGSVIEVLVSPEGNWTMIATKPNKLTCIIGTGAYGVAAGLIIGVPIGC